VGSALPLICSFRPRRSQPIGTSHPPLRMSTSGFGRPCSPLDDLPYGFSLRIYGIFLRKVMYHSAVPYVSR
jgi:hypothetical protein